MGGQALHRQGRGHRGRRRASASAYTHYSPLTGAEDSPENYHTLWWTLEEVSGGTQLVLNQDNNSSEEEADHNRDTWQQVMASLKKVAEGTD